MRREQTVATDAGVTLEIHRPLLALRRAELVDWLVERKFRWREDASNAQPIAVRNRLRNEALPLLNEISGRDAAAALVRGAAEAEEFSELELWAAEQANAVDPQGRLHLPALRKLPVALRRLILREYLRKAGVMGMDRGLLDRGLALLDPAGPPAVNLPGGGALRRRAGRIVFEI
jgi:tRNA(Ile)-lysidine synthase